MTGLPCLLAYSLRFCLISSMYSMLYRSGSSTVTITTVGVPNGINTPCPLYLLERMNRTTPNMHVKISIAFIRVVRRIGTRTRGDRTPYGGGFELFLVGRAVGILKSAGIAAPPRSSSECFSSEKLQPQMNSRSWTGNRAGCQSRPTRMQLTLPYRQNTLELPIAADQKASMTFIQMTRWRK